MMRIAAFQMLAHQGDVAANLDLIADAAGEAAGRGAQILVAPELATTGYGAGNVISSLAEPADGSQVAALAALAAVNNIVLVAGFPERDGTDVYNSAVLIEPSGRRHVYRKSHLYGEYERDLFAFGNEPSPVVMVGGLGVGLLICYDVEFPETVRRLALAGAELVLVPTALPASPAARFIAERVVPVRAFENGVVVVYADHAGSDERFNYAGRSCIAMPDGSLRAIAPAAGRTIILADYEPSNFAASRLANPYLADRRLEQF